MRALGHAAMIAGMADPFTRSSVRLEGPASTTSVEWVQRSQDMRRLLAFARRSIDDVVNCPVARREVISYYRIGNQMRRIAEIDSLEAQWNPLGRRA
jgi:hypothetical protein